MIINDGELPLSEVDNEINEKRSEEMEVDKNHSVSEKEEEDEACNMAECPTRANTGPLMIGEAYYCSPPNQKEI